MNITDTIANRDLEALGRLSRARFSSRARPATTRRARRGTWPWTSAPALSWSPGRPLTWSRLADEPWRPRDDTGDLKATWLPVLPG